MDIVTEKKCNTCNEVKKVEDFHRGKQCKECHKAWKRADYQKNKERYLLYFKKQRNKNIVKVKARRKEYYEKTKEDSKKKSLKWYYENKEFASARNSLYYIKNAEVKKEYARKWAKQNPDKVKENNKRWEQRNPEKVNARHKNWDLKNPEKRKIILKNSIYKRRGATHGKFTSEEWLNLCNKYNNQCLCCKRKVTLTVDHVIPISKGGSNTIDNIQPLCGSCNSRKGVNKTDFRY